MARKGIQISLLGFFCPFFWYSLFSGDSVGTVAFHAAHSGLVILIGVVFFIKGLKDG